MTMRHQCLYSTTSGADNEDDDYNDFLSTRSNAENGVTSARSASGSVLDDTTTTTTVLDDDDEKNVYLISTFFYFNYV